MDDHEVFCLLLRRKLVGKCVTRTTPTANRAKKQRRAKAAAAQVPRAAPLPAALPAAPPLVLGTAPAGPSGGQSVAAAPAVPASPLAQTLAQMQTVQAQLKQLQVRDVHTADHSAAPPARGTDAPRHQELQRLQQAQAQLSLLQSLLLQPGAAMPVSLPATQPLAPGPALLQAPFHPRLPPQFEELRQLPGVQAAAGTAPAAAGPPPQQDALLRRFGLLQPQSSLAGSLPAAVQALPPVPPPAVARPLGQGVQEAVRTLQSIAAIHRSIAGGGPPAGGERPS